MVSIIHWVLSRMPPASISSEIRCIHTKPDFLFLPRSTPPINFQTFPVFSDMENGHKLGLYFDLPKSKVKVTFLHVFLPDWLSRVLLLGFLLLAPRALTSLKWFIATFLQDKKLIMCNLDEKLSLMMISNYKQLSAALLPYKQCFMLFRSAGQKFWF